jgi:hypothetical protein
MRRLPSKILPTAFEAWTYLEPDRPLALKPVGIDDLLPPGSDPQLVSSVYGKIDTIVFYLPGKQEFKVGRPYGYTNFLVELMQRMGALAPRHFMLVIEREYELPEALVQFLQECIERQGSTWSTIVIPFQQKTLSPWVQDAFLAIRYKVEQTYKTYLVESYMNTSSKEATKEFLTASSNRDFHFQVSNLPFVGGNVLSSKRFTLIGLHDSCRELLDKIGARWLNEPLIVLSSKPTAFTKKWKRAQRTQDGVYNYYQAGADNQVLFHIDLFSTLAGRGARRRKVEYLVIGEPCIGFEGWEEAPADIQELTTEIVEETASAIEVIVEDIRTKLNALNIRFKIVRCPLPLTYYDQQQSIDGQQRSARYWCWATYNNCLVEQYFDEEDTRIRRVYLPSYGSNSNYAQHSGKDGKTYGDWTDLKKYDEQVKQLWEAQLDYEVTQLQTDYNPFIRYQGSLNCLTNVIKRT